MFAFYSESIHKFSFGDFVIRSTLPLVLSAIVCQLFRNSSAAARHRVWLLGLTAALMVPIAACLLPTITIPLMPSGVDAIDEFATQSAAKLIDAATLERASVQEIRSPSGQSVATASVAATDASHSNKAVVPLILQVAAKQILLFCWLFGICFGASGFILAALQQSMQIRRLSVVADEQWHLAVSRAAEQIGLVHCPKTVVSDQQCVPSIIGTVCPILIVPSHWRKWSPDEREFLLLHELAHIRRHDVPAQCLARIAILVHWFNPLVWFAARQMRIEREFASDDCVLHAGHSASNYAEHLLAIVNDYRSPKLTMGIAMASTARLDDRVRAILDPHRKRQPVGSWFSLMTHSSAHSCVLWLEQ